jgi:hypothetical protein
MANRTAALYIRITTVDGKKSYCKPVYQSKGRLKPQYAMVNGEAEHHNEGVYYLRFGTDGGKQKFVLIDKDPYVALGKLAEKQRWLRDRERQIVPLTPVNARPETSRLPEPKWVSLPSFEQMLMDAFDSNINIADDKVVTDYMSGGVAVREDRGR